MKTPWSSYGGISFTNQLVERGDQGDDFRGAEPGTEFEARTFEALRPVREEIFGNVDPWKLISRIKRGAQSYWYKLKL